LSSFIAALQFLTLFPWPERTERSADEMGRSAIFFPLTGLLLGSVLVLATWLVRPFATPGLCSVIVVALLAFLTGGLHLDGLADTFDGLGAGGDRDHMLAAMDDSRTGVFGVVAVVLVILFKLHAIESMADQIWRALLCAPLLSRWAMVLLAYRAEAAKDGLGSIWIGTMAPKHFFLATASAVILVAAILQVAGLLLMMWVAVFATACKRYFHRRLGGVTGDIFGAVGELTEGSVLVFLALATR
jgi:adenosylcobinamide-GDP ribazoletransferase